MIYIFKFPGRTFTVTGAATREGTVSLSATTLSGVQHENETDGA
jgi:hypothetical protein